MAEAMAAPLPRFVAVGEALTDLIRIDDDRWVSKVGGSTWNVARAVAAQGVASAFAGAISRCWFGDALWRASEAAALDLRFLQRVERSPLLAIVAESRPPRYTFVGDDSADLHFDPAALPPGWEARTAWAHFGGISLARSPLAERLVALATHLHAVGVAISYDPNVRNLMDERYLATFERMCRLASIIKLSDEDVAGLMRTDEPRRALQRAREWNPRGVVALHGGRGRRAALQPRGPLAGASPGDRGGRHGGRGRCQRRRARREPDARTRGRPGRASRVRGRRGNRGLPVRRRDAADAAGNAGASATDRSDASHRLAAPGSGVPARRRFTMARLRRSGAGSVRWSRAGARRCAAAAHERTRPVRSCRGRPSSRCAPSRGAGSRRRFLAA